MNKKTTFSELWKTNQKLRYSVILLLNTFLFYLSYRILLMLAEKAGKPFLIALVLIFYSALLIGFVLIYLIYNRFLYRKNIKEEDLPDTMTWEEKAEFVADSDRRLKNSKWMMLIILPLVITFLIDTVDLFILDLFR